MKFDQIASRQNDVAVFFSVAFQDFFGSRKSVFLGATTISIKTLGIVALGIIVVVLCYLIQDQCHVCLVS